MKRVKKIKRLCVECGKEFEVYPSRLNKDACKFCSRNCFFINLRKKLTQEGKTSPAQGKHWKHTKDYCKRMSLSKKREKNPAWIDGRTIFNPRNTVNSWKQKVWRRKILENAEYECGECGKKFEDNQLDAHHIQEWAKYPKKRFTLYNGSCLCKKCHKYIHWMEGRLNAMSKMQTAY